MAFYSVGDFVKQKNSDLSYYLIQNITGTSIVVDIYTNRSLSNSSIILPVSPDPFSDTDYELADVKAIFQIMTYDNVHNRAHVLDEGFQSYALATAAAGGLNFRIIRATILTDEDCEILGINPADPWPPTPTVVS